MDRPQRWDAPFGDLGDADVSALMSRSEFASIDASRFPAHIPLSGILKNDARLLAVEKGDIVVREGDYGNSAFLVLEGSLRVVLGPGLPADQLGRQSPRKKSFWRSLSQLWRNPRFPEARDTRRYRKAALREAQGDAAPRVFLQDIPVVLGKHRTAVLAEGSVFGELAALGRVPRTATVFADSKARLLEMRWQGLRELRRYDERWRRQIDERYRSNALSSHLQESHLFAGLSPAALQEIVDGTLFETYGSFDWNVSYQKLKAEGRGGAEHEPLIARQGDYPDGLLMIRAGFTRVSAKLGHGERTLTYLGAGDIFGLDELYASWRDKSGSSLATSLWALGYVDVLRVPAALIEKLVFPRISPPKTRLAELSRNALPDTALLEWAVEERFINGTQAMLIDLDRCTRCDDCVRACAATHDGNPRFIRHGKRFGQWMVANACMHCADPVCMIGCPTGAIHRTAQGGLVVINDDTCIGCQTCANSCPYQNIVMVPINDAKGTPVLDTDGQKPILKATKCDLSADQLGEPACVRACPHDALRRIDFKAALQTSRRPRE